MVDFVKDRTLADVVELENLLSKPYGKWSNTERDWFNNDSKGAYNWNDFNRLEEAVRNIDFLFEEAGLNRLNAVLNNWGNYYIPTSTKANKLIGDINIIRNTLEFPEGTPKVPISFNNMNHIMANNIEIVLELATLIAVNMGRGNKYVGEVYSGEEG